MEGGRPNIGSGLAEHFGKPCFQLVGSLIRKRYCEDAPRLDRFKGRRAPCLIVKASHFINILNACFFGDLIAVGCFAVAHEICNSVYEHRRFAAACARKDEQRALSRHDSLSLHGIKPGKIGLYYFSSRFEISFVKIIIHSVLFYHVRPALSRVKNHMVIAL